MSLVRGREFNVQDTGAALPVIIINTAIAEQHWPVEDPIGQQIQVVGLYPDEPRQIVGIIPDVRQGLPQDEQQAQVYVPFAQLPRFLPATTGRSMDILTYVVRTEGDPPELAPALTRAVAEIEPSQPVYSMQPVEQYVADQNEGYGLYVLLLGVFGGIALVLATVGIYGVMVHAVSHRTNEIGVRMALGASRSQVLRLLIRRGMLLTAIGLIVGVAGSLALTRIIANFLWGVTPTDPLTFGVVIVLLSMIALVACYIPARRASSVDPMVALRHE